MKKDPIIYIGHILESISLIEDYSHNMTIVDFLNSTQLQDSIIRRIEIIGEAAKNLSGDVRNDYPEVPWKKIPQLSASCMQTV